MTDNDNKTHLSIAVTGSVDSGKSSTTGHLIFKLGGISDRELEKLKEEARVLNKESFAFAFYMDRQKEERERGVTIAVTTKEFYTPKYHYTILDCPGHNDFIKNMIGGASQADCALLLVPADGNFTTSLAKGDPKKGITQGQTRQHARLLNLLGVTQLIVAVNKMDEKSANYTQERFEEVKNEMKNTLIRVGWKKDFVENNVPVIPLSGYYGDNLLEKSDKMPWWNGQDVKVGDKTVHVESLLDCLDNFVQVPKRPVDKDLIAPVTGVYKIKGVGDILTASIEQGTLKKEDQVKFMPTHTQANACTGKVFTIEMHHKGYPSAGPGDNIGMNVKNLNKENMPRTGDIMVLQKNNGVQKVKSFTAQVQVLDHPGELKVGYTPVCFVRTSRSAARIKKINWKVGKETGNQKLEDPVSIKTNEMAEVVFEPQQPFVVLPFKECEGLARVAFLDGNQVILLGKVVSVEV